MGGKNVLSIEWDVNQGSLITGNIKSVVRESSSSKVPGGDSLVLHEANVKGSLSSSGF